MHRNIGGNHSFAFRSLHVNTVFTPRASWNALMASRPSRNSARLRQRLSTTRVGSRVFHASSARRAFSAAVSAVKGGSGGFRGMLRRYGDAPAATVLVGIADTEVR